MLNAIKCLLTTKSMELMPRGIKSTKNSQINYNFSANSNHRVAPNSNKAKK